MRNTAAMNDSRTIDPKLSWDNMARELESEATDRENACIRNYGGTSIDQEQTFRSLRKTAELLRRIGSENRLHCHGIVVRRVRR